MKQIKQRFARGVVGALIVLLGTIVVAVPEASAHGVEKARYVDHTDRRTTRHFPRWLRAKRDFRHWYFQSRYRYVRRPSWQRLYELYLYDTARTHRRWRARSRHQDNARFDRFEDHSRDGQRERKRRG